MMTIITMITTMTAPVTLIIIMITNKKLRASRAKMF